MGSNNNRDETLVFNFQATGNEQLDALGKSIADIANGSSEAAPKAQELLEELNKLGQQNNLINNFVEQKAALTEVTEKLQQAKDGYAALNAEFTRGDASSRTISKDFAAAESAVTSLTARHNQLTAQLAATGNALNAAGVDTGRLDSAQRSAQQSLAASSEAAAALAVAHGKSSSAAKEEAVSIESLSEKYGLFGRVVENVKTLLATFAGLFALEKAKEQITEILATGDKFEKFGVDFANAFGGAAAGEEALAKVKELADAVPLSLDQVAAAAIKAKKEGLDPFDGTLQSLIDTNAKYGGSVETLNSLIDSLGRAYNRGSINTRELIALQQDGIPVTKILGDALGKTADEIQDMATKGQLGRESIRLLIDQLGQSAAGDASKQMGLLGTLATKVKDQWEEFLNLIGKSGAYEYVQSKLQGINEALKQGLADGSLKDKAQALSDAIVRMGQAVSGTLRFLYDHAEAIYDAARAYVVLRTAMLALDLAGAATKFVGLTAAVKETEGAVAAAAAEGGAFARIGNAIKAIPQQIKIAFTLVAADFAISQTEKVLDLAERLHQANQQYDASVVETIALRTQLADKASAIASRLKSYADTEIASADALQKKTRDQGAQYIEQLENATRYYNALRIQADASADFKGVEAATAKLKDLAVALDDAVKHQKDVTAALDESSVSAGALSVKFEELKEKGATAAEAIQGAFDHIQLTAPAGLNETIALIQQVSILARDGKQAIQAELAGALEKLNAADLRTFQENVTQRLKDAKGDAEALTVALQASLEAELLKLGLTAEQAGVQFTAAGQKIIETFSLITNNAKASGDQIQLAFAKALSSVQTEGEINALTEKLKAAFDAGKISAAQFQAGMEATGRKLADVQVAAAKAGAELDGMGKEGTTAAQRISTALQDTRDHLVVQANQIASAITKALQAGDTASADRLRGEFKKVDTQIQELNTDIQKLTPSYDAAGDAGERAGQRMADGAGRAAAGLRATAGAAGDAGTEISEATQKAEEGFTRYDDAADAAALATQGVSADTSHANETMNALTQGIGNARAAFLNVSDAAAKAYDTILKGAFDLGHSDDGTGLDKLARAMQVALDETNKEIAEQRQQLQAVISQYNTIGTGSVEAFVKLGGTVKYTNDQLGTMIEAIKAGNYDAGLLGQQELQPLLSALEAAKQRVDALKAATQQTNAEIADLNGQLQDQLDQQNNNQVAIENRSYETQKKHIEDLAAQADAAGKAQAAGALAKLNELHQAKLKAIADEAAAQQKANQQAQQSSGGSGGNVSSGSGASRAPVNIQPAQVSAALHPVTINLGGGDAIGAYMTPEQFVDALARAKQSSITPR